MESAAIIDRLKAETLPNHTRLEGSPLLLPLARQGVDRGSYQRLLALFYGYFHPLEALIDRFPAVHAFLPDYPRRRKADWLLQDLQQVVPSSEYRIPLLCDNLPEINHDSQALGCLYVMEGSTLGGQYISRVLAHQLGLEASTGARFFNGYGAETAHHWKAFQRALVAFNEQRGEPDLIIEAANQTFEKLSGWLATESVPT